MAARHEPTPARRGGDRRRGDGRGEPRRRPRHSVAETDPLYWARARAAEEDLGADPFGRPAEVADSEAATEEFPPIGPEWSGRLPLPTPPGRPARSAWSIDDHGGRAPEDATTDSLPAIGTGTSFLDGEAPTVDLPAVPSAEPETVDYRDRPLALVPRSDRAVVPYDSGRSTSARRSYAGRHRPPPTPAPTRLGLSTVGMTVAVGVLGATLAVLHAQPNNQSDRSTPPLAAVSPTGTPDTAEVAPDGAPATGPEPTPGPEATRVPRPSTAPGTNPTAARPDVPAAAPGVPGADGGGDSTVDERSAAPGTPRSGGRPTQPDTATRPTPRTTPRCATSMSDRGSVRTNAIAGVASSAADATTGAEGTTQADPEETPSESAEPTDEPNPSASAGC